VSELTLCPNCGSKIRVVETDPLEQSIERVRLCPKCGRQVVTGETILRVRYEGDCPQSRA
jgi:transcriptional regulator NrdR family protein